MIGGSKAPRNVDETTLSALEIEKDRLRFSLPRSRAMTRPRSMIAQTFVRDMYEERHDSYVSLHNICWCA